MKITRMFCEKSVCVWNGRDFTWENWPQRFYCEFYRSVSGRFGRVSHGADPGDAIWAASPVTLFGAATSGGKKADKRLLFGRVRRRGQRAESWTGISNQSCNSTLHKASTFFASVGALDISKILWLGHFWDNRQQELRTQGSQTGSHLGNRCS